MIAARITVPLLLLFASTASAQRSFPASAGATPIKVGSTTYHPKLIIFSGVTPSLSSGQLTLTVDAVPTTRTLTATSPLTIGGSSQALDLSANRTLACPTCVTATYTGDLSFTAANNTPGIRLMVPLANSWLKVDSAAGGVEMRWNNASLVRIDGTDVILSGSTIRAAGTLNPYTNLGYAIGTSALAFTEINVRHIIGRGSAPTIVASSGMGSASGGVCTLAGTDVNGTISCTTGTGPCSGSSTAFTVTYNTTHTSTGRPILQAANANAAALGGNGNVYVSSADGTQFLVSAGATSIDPCTTDDFVWYYHNQF